MVGRVLGGGGGVLVPLVCREQGNKGCWGYW